MKVLGLMVRRLCHPLQDVEAWLASEARGGAEKKTTCNVRQLGVNGVMHQTSTPSC